ncbi:MAG: hypothetical protein V1829_02055 [bacterium]
MEIILNKIFENFPLIFAFTLGGFFVWIVARFYFGRFCPLETKVNNLPNAIKTIIKELIADYILADLPKKSPITLDKDDVDLIEQSGFDVYIQNNKDALLAEFEKNKPENRIEGLKQSVVLVMQMDEEGKIDLNKLKDLGYQKGMIESYLQTIAGVYLWQHIIEPELYKDY